MAIKRINGVVTRITTYDGRGMRKHAGDRQEFKDREVEALDAIAARKVAPMGAHGLVIHRATR